MARKILTRHIESELPTPFWQKLFDIAEIEALLQATAREEQVISYAETLNALGMNFSRPKMRALCTALGEVDRRAARRGEPELAILVVRASDKIPGAGWWEGREDYKGRWEGPKAEKYIRAIQAKAFDFWKANPKT